MKTLGKEGLKNLAIAFFGATTLVAGYLTYDQYKLNNTLYDQILELEVKLDQNALETQEAMEAFADIEINLAEIRESEGYLQTNLNSEEFDASNTQERIMHEIVSIENLIAENKKIIKDLETEVGEKDSRLSKYRKSVASLEGRLKNYRAKTEALTAQAEELKEHLVQTQEENEQMTQELVVKEIVVEAQSKAIEQRDKELRTAYYTIGSFKQLKEDNVVEREGGILGIAAAKTVKDDLNRDRFTEIDISHYTTIPVYSKKVELISNHNSDSYEFVKDADGHIQWINILDPELFWENTKYLVIATKGEQFDQAATKEKGPDDVEKVDDGLVPELWFSAN